RMQNGRLAAGPALRAPGPGASPPLQLPGPERTFGVAIAQQDEVRDATSRDLLRVDQQGVVGVERGDDVAAGRVVHALIADGRAGERARTRNGEQLIALGDDDPVRATELVPHRRGPDRG